MVVGSDEELALRAKYPYLTADLVKMPRITRSNAAAIASDVKRAYYGTGGQASTPLVINSLNSAQLASLYQLVREVAPELKPLVDITGQPPISRNWFSTMVNSSKETFMSYYQDFQSYLQLYRIATRSPQHYQRISQYPFETTSWRDLVTDLNLLRSIAQTRGWI